MTFVNNTLYLTLHLIMFISARPCTTPLGLANGRLSNRAISASSSLNAAHAPLLARLRRAKTKRYSSSWVSKQNSHREFIQVFIFTNNIARFLKENGHSVISHDP
jgi:hypothetical protein